MPELEHHLPRGADTKISAPCNVLDSWVRIYAMRLCFLSYARALEVEIVARVPVGCTTAADSSEKVSGWVNQLSSSPSSEWERNSPIVFISQCISYRLGIFGSAAGPILREDNKLAGDHGVGNYGACQY